MTRIDGRKFDELRPVTIDAGFVDYAEGSVLITCGHTKVLCCASISVPLAESPKQTSSISRSS